MRVLVGKPAGSERRLGAYKMSLCNIAECVMRGFLLRSILKSVTHAHKYPE